MKLSTNEYVLSNFYNYAILQFVYDNVYGTYFVCYLSFECTAEITKGKKYNKTCGATL